ncbi:protein kinase [Nocardia sp. NPDC127579]|uniref:serine/threonine protein kinase n=1 Tax=Nocardia sp. NPDC127579 TaxID=3345402 RepID=UPI00363E70AA
MVLQAGTQFAGFTIERRLGSGGMGTVYLAGHPRLQRQVALKVLANAFLADPKARSAFDREATVAAGLDHPNIVPVYDRSEAEDPALWLTMRYIDGGDAAKLLDRHPDGLDADRAVRLLTGAAHALDYAHEQGVLHRDVKPANLLIENSPMHGERAVLTDFGIARTLDDTVTLSGIAATFAYAAPERFTDGPTDHRADVYSLGCTLFQLLTGRTPFPRKDQAAVIGAHLGAPPPAPRDRRPDLPAELDTVIATALAKSPEDRYPNCTALAEAAAHALHSAARAHAAAAPTETGTPQKAPLLTKPGVADRSVPESAGDVSAPVAAARRGGPNSDRSAPELVGDVSGPVGAARRGDLDSGRSVSELAGDVSVSVGAARRGDLDSGRSVSELAGDASASVAGAWRGGPNSDRSVSESAGDVSDPVAGARRSGMNSDRFVSDPAVNSPDSEAAHGPRDANSAPPRGVMPGPPVAARRTPFVGVPADSPPGVQSAAGSPRRDGGGAQASGAPGNSVSDQAPLPDGSPDASDVAPDQAHVRTVIRAGASRSSAGFDSLGPASPGRVSARRRQTALFAVLAVVVLGVLVGMVFTLREDAGAGGPAPTTTVAPQSVTPTPTSAGAPASPPPLPAEAPVETHQTAAPAPTTQQYVPPVQRPQSPATQAPQVVPQTRVHEWPG